jgi:hypothetical protein
MVQLVPARCRVAAAIGLVCLWTGGCEPPQRQGAGIVPLNSAVPAANNGGASAALPALPGLQAVPALSAGYPTTPQAVLERAQAAATAGQWQEYVKYLSPDSINGKFDAYIESAVTWDERSIARSAEPRVQELASRLASSMQALFAALEARGITRAMLAEAKFNPEAKAKLLDNLSDKPAFIADVMARGGGGTDGNLLRQFRADNWQVEDELATVDLVAERNGRELRLPLEIKKIDGWWKLEM